MNDIDLFRKAVNKHFAFLSQRGFFAQKESNVGEWDCFLEYSSASVSVMVCYGPPEFHAELSFWRKTTPSNRFGTADLLAVGQDPALWNADIDTKGIEQEVSWLASAVHSVENLLCSGDIEFYEKLAAAQHSRRTKWVKEENLRSVRNKVATAWQEKNYEQVIILYNSIRTELTAVEKKRLSYAENKLN